MSLDALQAAMKQAEKQLKKDAAAGEFAKQKVSMEPAGFTTQPVFDYYNHVKREPREILEARYLSIVGEDPPPLARHDWLATRCAYTFQLAYYEATLGKIPPIVFWRAEEWKRIYPGGPVGLSHDAGDPAPDTYELWDDAWVVAVAKNPYARGDARAAFHALEMFGVSGVQFEPLCKTLEGMLETSVGNAQDVALSMFTKKVREGLTKVEVR